MIMYSVTDSSSPQELSKEAVSPDKDEAPCTGHATVIAVHPPDLCMNLADWMLLVTAVRARVQNRSSISYPVTTDFSKRKC